MVCKTFILHYFKCTVNLQTYITVNNVINAIYLELFIRLPSTVFFKISFRKLKGLLLTVQLSSKEEKESQIETAE